MPNDKTKIFVPNKGTHDFSPAERFGELVYVTRGEISKFATGVMARAWAKVLAESSPNDFILVTSLTTLCSIGCAMFALKHGQLNQLIFRNGAYISRRLMLKQVLEDAKEAQLCGTSTNETP